MCKNTDYLPRIRFVWLIFDELAQTDGNIRRKSVSDRRLVAGWETYLIPNMARISFCCHVQTCMATLTQDATCNSGINSAIIR